MNDNIDASTTSWGLPSFWDVMAGDDGNEYALRYMALWRWNGRQPMRSARTERVVTKPPVELTTAVRLSLWVQRFVGPRRPKAARPIP